MTLRMRRFVLFAAFLCMFVGCETEHPSGKDQKTISFIQLTDLHLFLDTSKDSDATKKATRIAQEKLDQSAVSDAWKSIGEIGASGRSSSFVVITGDLGVDPCSIADLPENSGSKSQPTTKDCVDKVNKDKRSTEISTLADALGASPIRDIYLVPGNNDMPFESASDDGITYFDRLIDEVQQKINSAKKNVQLHDLNRCYLSGGDPAGCYFDISHTAYRMIGFPSYSFKNREAGSDSNPALQEKQVDIFRGLLKQSREAGKKVLIVSHVPVIDDPYLLAQDRFAAVNPPSTSKDADSARSKWSTWNVTKQISDAWQQAIADDAVVAVFAGHLHDSHKEIYQRPFSWSSVNDPKNGFGKLYLAPPLSVKNQDTSPIQARGLVTVRLGASEIGYRIYWYEAQTAVFTPTPASMPQWTPYHGHMRWHQWRRAEMAILWLWRLADPQNDLSRMAVLLIAFLAAFLTVVQVWQIPPPELPSQSKNANVDAKQDNLDGSKTQGSKSTFDPSPFASNFGKTVITGLGGLAAAVLVKSLDGGSGALDKSDNKFYVVWFILFFFLFLALGAAFRAAGESLRERLTILHPKPEFKMDPRYGTNPILWFWSWLKFGVARFWKWVLSLRSSILTFLDTFMNLIQGKNQTLTRAFSATIVKQQKNVVCVAQVMRQQLNDLILEYLNTSDERKPEAGDTKKNKRSPLLGARDVRVSISVLSEDGSNVFYIARSPESSRRVFPKLSVAWVSVVSGKILWYKHQYHGQEENIELLDNTNGVIPDRAVKVVLGTYYQQREDDYNAFVIFPVPWPNRASGSDAIRGAIHISFRNEDDFSEIWTLKTKLLNDKNVDLVLADQKYPSGDEMLGDLCQPDEVRVALRQSVAMLGQLLCGFNESIYKNSVSPNDCC